jgi:integrase
MARRKKKTKDAKLGSVYSRKGVWYVRFMVNGKEHRESSKSTDQDVALAYLEKRRSEVIAGKITPEPPPVVTFDDLVKLIEQDSETNKRKSLPSLRYRIARLRVEFGKTPPIEITHKMLKGYVADRLKEGAKPATVRYELVALGRMFRLAVEVDMLSTAPSLPTVKIRNVRKGFFESDEIERVLKHQPEDIAPAIRFAYITGWRIGEVRKLTWTGHLDLDAGVIRLERDETKNEEGRTFVFAAHPALTDLVIRQCERGLPSALGGSSPALTPRPSAPSARRGTRLARRPAVRVSWSTIYAGRPSGTSSVRTLTSARP